MTEVAAASGDDDVAVWAAQGMIAGVRAWALGGAVVVASPALSRRDRLAVTGPPGDAAVLVRYALGECGPAFRPFGDAPLIASLAGVIGGLAVRGRFAWMSTGHVTPGPSGGGWLGEGGHGDVTRLLAAAFPTSYAMPGIERVARWAGIRDEATGELVTVAADAWSAPEIGFLAGVATAVSARGSGLAERVCRFAAADLAGRHGRVALMADDGNDTAIRLYERLGFTARRLAAAAIG